MSGLEILKLVIWIASFVGLIFIVCLIMKMNRNRRARLARAEAAEKEKRDFFEKKAKMDELIVSWNPKTASWAETVMILRRLKILSGDHQLFLWLGVFDKEMDGVYLVEDSELILRLLGDLIHQIPNTMMGSTCSVVAEWLFNTKRFEPTESQITMTGFRHAEVPDLLRSALSRLSHERLVEARNKKIEEALAGLASIED